MKYPRIIGEGLIPEAECVRDVQMAMPGRSDVVLLAHAAKALEQDICEESTIYNLEPLFDGCRSLRAGYLDILQRHKVWDYQSPNVEYLKKHDVDAVHVPYRFSEWLDRVKPRVKDIDVLFVGSMSERRRRMLADIDDYCCVKSVQGVYGAALDALVARARVVLNVHYCDDPHPLEVVRINYMMANGACVVSERGWDETENMQYENGLVFSDDVTDACLEMLQADRSQIEAAARRVARSMPMQVPK